VHLYGQCADMPRIADTPRRHGLALVEDAAPGARRASVGQAAGTYGLGCFSFYGTKNLTTGEGGMITTNDDAIADRLRVCATRACASATSTRWRATTTG
jgi:dTDP-4-amino-4,6-dideoxygalactose transaminase